MSNDELTIKKNVKNLDHINGKGSDYSFLFNSDNNAEEG
jgi:hypothetical protein